MTLIFNVMPLNTKTLQKVMKQALDEHNAVNNLRREVVRVLGPIMDTTVKLESLAEAVNDRVSVLSMTGRSSQLLFKPSTVLPFIDHKDAEVRTMSANLIPNRYLDRLKFDHSSAVRAVVARRTDMQTVKEMMRRFPQDDGLRAIFRQKQRLLGEAGLPNPKIDDEEFDIYGEERLGDAVKQPVGPELSDQWYEAKAAQLCKQYDGKIEFNWEERAVRNFVRAMKTTSMIDVDEEKLLKCVFDYIKEREDRVLERDALKELASSLYEQEDLLQESLFDVVDPVQQLVTSDLVASTFVEQANKVFNVKEATIPAAIQKFRSGSSSTSKMIPVKATLPHDGSPRQLDERALDLYVKHWNDKQRLTGEPIMIEWTSHPDQINVISFRSVLR